MNKLPGGVVNMKVHTLKDLAYYTPAGKNAVKQKWLAQNKENRILAREARFDKEMGLDTEPEIAPKNNGNQVQVKFDENGQMVVDDTSLFVHEETFEETFEQGNQLKHFTSTAYMKRKPTTRKIWSKLETDMFYEVLSAVGTDFSILSDYIPGRSRAQLKAKYNSELKVNQKRLDDCLQYPAIFDDTEIRRIVKNYDDQIEAEKQARNPRKTRRIVKNHEDQIEEEHQVRKSRKTRRTVKNYEDQLEEEMQQKLLRKKKMHEI